MLLSLLERGLLGGGRSRKIARPFLIAGAAFALATMTPAAFAASGKDSVADVVAVSVTANTKSKSVAPSRIGGSAETLIADFRYGAPRMGSTPRLPIPPPHRLRSGSAHPSI